MKTAYIVSARRSPIAKAPHGYLHQLRPDDFGATVLNAALNAVPQIEPMFIDDVIIGCAMPEAEQGFNLGRVLGQRAGLPDLVPGVTVNRFCASGLQAIAQASQTIALGQAQIIIAGGAESMSLIPMGGHRVAPNPELIDRVPEAYCTMGLTAENVAAQYDISRADQDAFALRSHQRAIAAIQAGHFTDEIVPIAVSSTTYLDGQVVTTNHLFDTDEGPRPDTSLEALSKLPAVFRRGGSVTAGNASQMSDGAAMTVLMGETLMYDLKIQPLGRLIGYAVAGVPPEIMGIGPTVAIPKVLQQVGLSLKDIGLIELNEAFAAQALAVIRKLELNEDIVNVNGGAIALGHPLGCTGARLTTSLLYEMQRRNVRYGLISMCIGGGMGAAGIVENLML
jgi:acetyl-CoA acyltransferase